MVKTIYKYLACMVIPLSLTACGDSNQVEDLDETVSLLEDISEKTTDTDMVILHRNAEPISWEIRYSTDNEAVFLYDSRIDEIFVSELGFSPFDDESYFAYDFDENSFRIYFDSSYSELLQGISSVNYSVSNDEYTLLKDGEHYSVTNDFLQFTEDAGLKNVMMEDLDSFKEDLANNSLSYDDVSDLTYEDFN